MENSTQPNLGQQVLKNGLIWGAINIVLFLVTWYTMSNSIGSTWYGILTIVIGILLAVYFCKDLRTQAGGYWSFGQALWPIFGMFILSAGLYFVFNIAFGKYIDTTYPETMKEIVAAKSSEIYENLGMSQDQLDEAMAAQAEEMEAQFNPTFAQGVKGFGIVAIMYFLGALIFALIFKKTDPNPWKDVLEDETSSPA